jgi:Bifunctional DNA primase/polymerase, N-terminal
MKPFDPMATVILVPHRGLDVALKLAATGLRVFPCDASKRPTISHPTPGRGGFHGASNSEEVLRAHWARFSGQLVGYPTGKETAVDVFDVDERAGGHLWLADNWHLLPRTFTYRTGGNGGWHLHFLHRDGQRSVPQGKIGQGVEIKADGGYAIAWWAHGTFVLDNSPPAPWPEWLVKLIPATPPPLPQRLEVCRSLPSATAAVYAASELKDAVRYVTTACNGDRNNQLFKSSCRMAEWVAIGAIDIDRTLVALLAAARHVEVPSREAARTVLSAFQKVRADAV